MAFYLLLGRFVLQAIGAILTVERPRPPRSPLDVVAFLVGIAICIYAVSVLWSTAT